MGVGHNVVKGGHAEDAGFAINGGKGWSDVVFDNHQIKVTGGVAIAMGNYYFTCATTGKKLRSSILSATERMKMARCAFSSTTPRCHTQLALPLLAFQRRRCYKHRRIGPTLSRIFPRYTQRV